MKFNSGDKVELKEKAIKEYKALGAWHWMFNGVHEVSHYSGKTLYTSENLGIHNDNDLVLVETNKQEK